VLLLITPVVSQCQLTAMVSFAAVNPVKEIYDAMVAGSLSASNPMVLSAVAHVPWLLPRGTKLPYSGLENDLDGLLRTQANRTVHGFPAVTMIFFNHYHRVMLMNCIYSLVKFAGKCLVRRREWVCPSSNAEACSEAADSPNTRAALLLLKRRWALVVRNGLRPCRCFVRHTQCSPSSCAGVSSYIVLVWDKKSLDTCLQMNLPCYNAAKFLPNPINDDHQEALFATQSYTQIM